MRKKKPSIRTRLTAFIVLLELLLALAAFGACGSVLSNVVLAEYKNSSDDVLLAVRDILSEDILQGYAETLRINDKYDYYDEKLLEILHKDTSLTDIHVVLQDGDTMKYLFTTDQKQPNCGIGKEVYFDRNSRKVIMEKDYGNGEGFITLTHDEGVKYSVFYPLATSNDGREILLGIDYSGKILLWEIREYAATPILIYLLVFLALLLFTEAHLRRMIIRPLDNLAKKAKDYMKDGYDAESLDELRNLPIKSYEEFENLRDSMVTMGENTNHYIESIRSVTWESEHDAMTMLHNRAKFRKRLEEEYPYVDSIYIAYLDVNNLKEMNDMFGHTAGDAIILKLAEKLRGITSETIHTYRWGGDEFLVVMCNYSEDEAKKFLEGWHSRIGRLNRQVDKIQCTVAYGGAYASGDFVMETIVEMADDAMYRTKSRQKLDERMERIKSEKE